MGIDIKIQKRLGAFQLMVQFHGASNRIGILGASGCGKSMTLKCIAGIEKPQEGWIRLGEQVLFDSQRKQDVKPQKRNIGYLFQNYALFPTMTVAENIGVGIKGSQEEKRKRVGEMIEIFRLSGLEHHFPRELSGGQQQRTALARIMAYKPGAILLDEPFSAMDVFLKDQLQQELAEMLKDYAGTVILVSHSRDEIYRFSQELLVMDQGRDVIFGETKEIFERPRYREAARLTGCKNFSRIRRVNRHLLEALDWGIMLQTRQEVPKETGWIGYRAHDFVPVWGERQENCLKVCLESVAKLPFECNYYLRPEWGEVSQERICWFLQRERQQEIEEKGLPDYLAFREEKMMFLM